MNVSTTLCLRVRCPSRARPVYHDAYLLSRGYISCIYVYSTICMYAPTVHCLFGRYFPVARAPKLPPPPVHHCVYSSSQGYLLCMCVCSTLGMYASTVFSTFAPCLPVTRARTLARRS